ncbi:hypothetical protein [Paenibacillus soyae]|uniref:Uncharacterized protein n=1 Tax=Paenibacillus soyae TaxID=2969249 RepID=A0A9X2SAB0_9BACL|nr:hypothetical protein [Paenibacillus soyae]MCR2806419.1 hypothetical protein [Paenibacillus soyae]
MREIASRALAKPLLPSGLWYHGDIRDNFYDASYLFAAAREALLDESDTERANSLACGVLSQVLALQDGDSASPTYGHFPLNLGDDPRQASAHPLPVELMGPLMALFAQRYGKDMPAVLRNSFDQAVRHMHASGYYKAPLALYNHHEAKHTAAGLIYASILGDEPLLRASHDRLRSTLNRVREYGMTEYGILPWFWHWAQAFAAAWELVPDEAIRDELDEMLEWLWEERSDYYLHGAWVGPHSRSWPHDAPADRNQAMDYVQFGDIPLPSDWPRVEYAGLLSYEISEAARSRAFNRAYPCELRRTYPLSAEQPSTRLHSYVYMTERYALGGMKERRLEFDNEQRRWDLSFPVREGSVNQAYFYSPAGAADDRHSSDAEEIAIYKGTLIALYRPHSQDIAGVLPIGDGEWVLEETSLYGVVNETYIAVHAKHPLRLERGKDRYDVRTEGAVGNVIVLEAVTMKEAASLGIESFESFVSGCRLNKPSFAEAPLDCSYSMRGRDTLELRLVDDGPIATVNGEDLWTL